MAQIVKPPKPMRMIWGFAGAFWLAGFFNPGFFVVAGICLLYIPVLMINNYLTLLDIYNMQNSDEDSV